MSADIIDAIEDVRKQNNALWMTILRIALESDPERTKRTLGFINQNDREISTLLEKLSK